MTRRALVVGIGIAGLSCAELLVRQGWEVELRGPPARPAPALLLNNVTCALLLDIWQAGVDLFEGSVALFERRIRWGHSGAAASVAEPGVVITGDLLSGRLLERLTRRHRGRVRVNDSPVPAYQLADPNLSGSVVQEVDWVVGAGGRSAHISRALGVSERRSFGNRCAICTEVTLARGAERNTCWIETVRDGWVFLVPIAGDRAFLQVMVPRPPERPSVVLADLLEQTRMAKVRVTAISGSAKVFAAYPQISDPLCGSSWITVGDAAISFDPICGDGTGCATRGAILAASVLEGMASGLPSQDCLRHYAMRLHKTLSSHLHECLGYYSAGFSSSAWGDEIALMQATAASADHQPTGSEDSFVYGLRGLNLVPLDLPA